MNSLLFDDFPTMTTIQSRSAGRWAHPRAQTVTKCSKILMPGRRLTQYNLIPLVSRLRPVGMSVGCFSVVYLIERVPVAAAWQQQNSPQRHSSNKFRKLLLHWITIKAIMDDKYLCQCTTLLKFVNWAVTFLPNVSIEQTFLSCELLNAHDQLGSFSIHKNLNSMVDNTLLIP